MDNSSLILSLDGGGMLGRGPAQALAALESEYGEWREALLAGTSVGGMLVLLRASGRSWQEVSRISEEAVPAIFGSRDRWPFHPKWSDEGRQAICKKYLDMPCSAAKIPFVVTASDTQVGDGLLITQESDWSMRDAALATSAAPTYFPPFQDRYVDGGLVANNPTLVALAAARKMRLASSPADVRVLSLATGGQFWKPSELTASSSLVSILKAVLKMCLAGNQETVAELAEWLLDERHTRVAPKDLKDYPMDDLSLLPEWLELWKQAYTDNKDAMRRVVYGAR